MTNTYDTGRLDLPFVGVATFGKRPLVTDWSAIDAEVAVREGDAARSLGLAPGELVEFRPGAPASPGPAERRG